MPAMRFRQLAERSKPFRRILNRYLYVLTAGLSQTAACSRFHLLDARMARWLLMTHDRAHSDTFRLTHQFLAYMLGVRRAGVTEAAGHLQAQGLIRYARGELAVVDRATRSDLLSVLRHPEKHLPGVSRSAGKKSLHPIGPPTRLKRDEMRPAHRIVLDARAHDCRASARRTPDLKRQ
jgi:hypothetical protein